MERLTEKKVVGTESDVEKFIICYSNGETKTIEKGFFCEMKDGEEGTIMSFTMAGVSGRELENIVFGCIQLGVNLGMFDGKDSEQNGNS